MRGIPIDEDVIAAIRKYMRDSGKTQKELAGACGVEQASLSKWLKGRVKFIRPKTWVRLRAVIGEYLPEEMLPRNEVGSIDPGVPNTTRLRTYLKGAAFDQQLSLSTLSRYAQCKSERTLARLFNGELPTWFFRELAAVATVLGIEFDALPISDEDRGRLGNVFNSNGDRGYLVPLVDIENIPAELTEGEPYWTCEQTANYYGNPRSVFAVQLKTSKMVPGGSIVFCSADDKTGEATLRLGAKDIECSRKGPRVLHINCDHLIDTCSANVLQGTEQ